MATESFVAGTWKESIDVRDFIQRNYTPYAGDAAFLCGATARTKAMMEKVQTLLTAERKAGGVLDVDTETVAGVTAFAPGYVDRENECIVGLQTAKPPTRAVNPFGGMRMVRQACAAYGYTLSDEVEKAFRRRTTHNEGVFAAYTDEMRRARHAHLLTGLPDAYGRGRIIGDYRRVALYGVERLIAEKKADKAALAASNFDSPQIRLAEELSRQIAALYALSEMAKSYGFDLSLIHI